MAVPLNLNHNPEYLMRILVVEDEKKVASALKQGLEAEHYEVVLA